MLREFPNLWANRQRLSLIEHHHSVRHTARGWIWSRLSEPVPAMVRRRIRGRVIQDLSLHAS